MEEEFGRAETSKLMKSFLLSRDPAPPRLPKEISFAAYINVTPTTLPSWLTDEDINYYAAKFNHSGFTGGLNYYRCLDLYAFFPSF